MMLAIKLLFLAFGFLIIGLAAYVVWFRYDLVLRSYAQSRVDDDLYSFYEFRKWIGKSKYMRKALEAVSGILMIIWVLVARAILSSAP